jgi:hypothetical protein
MACQADHFLHQMDIQIVYAQSNSITQLNIESAVRLTDAYTK